MTVANERCWDVTGPHELSRLRQVWEERTGVALVSREIANVQLIIEAGVHSDRPPQSSHLSHYCDPTFIEAARKKAQEFLKEVYLIKYPVLNEA